MIVCELMKCLHFEQKLVGSAFYISNIFNNVKKLFLQMITNERIQLLSFGDLKQPHFFARRYSRPFRWAICGSTCAVLSMLNFVTFLTPVCCIRLVFFTTLTFYRLWNLIIRKKDNFRRKRSIFSRRLSIFTTHTFTVFETLYYSFFA